MHQSLFAAARENEAAREQADPFVGGSDELVSAGPTNGARHTAIVRRLRDSGRLALVVTGGDRDLSEQIKQLRDQRCEYVKVAVKSWPADQPDIPAAGESLGACLGDFAAQIPTESRGRMLHQMISFAGGLLGKTGSVRFVMAAERFGGVNRIDYRGQNTAPTRAISTT